MNRKIIVALAALAISSSCSHSYYLAETRPVLVRLDEEYGNTMSSGEIYPFNTLPNGDCRYNHTKRISRLYENR